MLQHEQKVVEVSSITPLHFKVRFRVADDCFQCFIGVFHAMTYLVCCKRSIRRIALVGAWVNRFATFPTLGREYRS